MFIYWIKHKNHADITKQGYVGITVDFNQRMFSHKSYAVSGFEYPISKAIRKYKWENLEKKIILEGDEEYCQMIEFKLRPKQRIGWNLNCGGIIPPNQKGKKQSLLHLENRKKSLLGRESGFKNKKHSDLVKEKCRLANLGKPKSEESKKKNSEKHKKPIQINGIIYASWQDASKETGIPTGSLSYLLAGKISKTSKYNWINQISLVA
jgi:hypothetical protein